MIVKYCQGFFKDSSHEVARNTFLIDTLDATAIYCFGYHFRKTVMPVIKSAKKKARQALKHLERNKGMRTQVKTYIKKVLVLSKSNVEEAKKVLPVAYSVLDTAAKKHILHKNTAARKKSLLARSVAKGGTAAPVKAAAPKAAKKPAEKKVAKA